MSTQAARKLVLFMLAHGMNTENGTVSIVPRGDNVVICTTILAKYCRAAGFSGEETTKKWVISTLKQLGGSHAATGSTRAMRVDALAGLGNLFGLSAFTRGHTTNHSVRMDGFLEFDQSRFFALANSARNRDGKLMCVDAPDFAGFNFGCAPFYLWGVHGADVSMPIAGKPWWLEVAAPCHADMSAFAARVRNMCGGVEEAEEAVGVQLFGAFGRVSREPPIAFADVVLSQQCAGRKKRRMI